MKVKIEVTQDDIDSQGTLPISGCSCPVFRAALRVLPDVRWVYSFGITLGLGDYTDAPQVNIPPEASNFINEFGYSRPVAPFSFEVDVPDELLADGTVQP